MNCAKVFSDPLDFQKLVFPSIHFVSVSEVVSLVSPACSSQLDHGCFWKPGNVAPASWLGLPTLPERAGVSRNRHPPPSSRQVAETSRNPTRLCIF